ERAGNAAPTVREGTLLTDLGAALRLQRKLPESIEVQREALGVRIAVSGERSLAVAETRNNLASTLLQSDDVEGAVTEFSRSLEVRRGLLRPDHPLVVRC